MRGKAMRSVCERLENMGIDLSKLSALEFFAREGDWQTTAYADKVGSLEAWEINPQYEKILEKNLPKARIKIGDSFELAKQNTRSFDLVVFDNPQNTFGDYCEHFEALKCLLFLMAKGIVIFNVNKEPYDLEKYPEWKQRRDEFYNGQKPDIEFYRKLFKSMGFGTEFAFEEPRNDYLSYYVFGLN